MKIANRLKQRPTSVIYALSLALYMSALYHSAPDVALLSSILLIGTIWYVHTDTEQSEDTSAPEGSLDG